MLILAIVGAATLWSRRRLRTGDRRRWSHAGWALGCLAILVAVKAVVDILVATPWARAWYSAPQRLLAAFAIGALAAIGAIAAATRGRAIGGLATLGLAVVLLPLNLSGLVDASRRTHAANNWQDQIDLAATWILDQGPDGRYGARDAGLLGFRLDGHQELVNLDGLVNNYDFAELVVGDASMVERFDATRADYFVGRTSPGLRRELGCGTVLWTSPGLVQYVDPYGTVTHAPVEIVDVRACRSGP